MCGYLVVVLLVVCVWRFCPKEVPFSGFSCVKGHGFHQLRYMKAEESGSLDDLKGLRDAFYGYEKSRESVLAL